MTWEDYATNDTAHGGACETEHDIELDEIRRQDELDEAREVIAEQRSFAPRECLMDGSDCGSNLCPLAEQQIWGFSHTATVNRALKHMRKAAVSQGEEGGFIGAALRDRGVY
jgi:hypothetical protein